MPITQSITVLPTPPSRADPENFDTRADAFLGALPTMQTQMNTWAGQANQTALDIGIVSEGLTSTTAGANKVPLADGDGKIDTAWLKVGTGSDDVAAGDHDHASTYQPLDADLTAVAGLSTTGLIERTGAGTAGIVTVTTAGKALLDDADAAAQRTTLGIGGFSQDGSGNFTRIVPGGSTGYPDFPVRAWADVDGVAATPAISSGGNVSSITDFGTGAYRINLTTALDSEKGVIVGIDTTYSGYGTVHGYTFSASAFDVTTINSAGSPFDQKFMVLWSR